jgi:hypothetical protein
MKGLYPAVVYVLLFAVGLISFASIYYFTDNFVSEKNIKLEEAQSEKICVFLQNLEDKEGEFEVDIGNFRIETNPLRIVGSSVYNCEIDFNSSGSCSGECGIRMLGNRIVFS